MIAAAALPETKLIQPGALVTYDYRLRLPAGADAVAWASAARAAFPQAGWQIRSFREAARPLQGLLDRIAQFLSLVGLTALLVGGVGIGNAIRGHIAAKTATIATLKCLGASTRLVFAVYLIEVMALALLGIGGALGAGRPVPDSSATAACRRAAGLGSARPLSHAAGFGGTLWPVDDAALRAVAARRDRPDPGWRIVSRRRRPGPSSRSAVGAGGNHIAGPRASRAGRRRGAGPPRRAVVYCRGDRRLRHLPGRRRGRGPRRRPARPAAAPAVAPSARQFAPAGRAHGPDRAVARHRADRADRGGAGRSQPFPRDRNPAAGRGARVFLYRHPAGPARRVRGDRARHPRRAPRPGADDARPHHPAERGSGRKDGGDARGAMGIAQRPRADLCRDFAGRLAARRRVVVAARVSWPAARLIRRRSCARHGAQGRRQPDRQPAWARDHRAHRQSARDRLAAARHQLRPGLCARARWSTRRRPISRPSICRKPRRKRWCAE